MIAFLGRELEEDALAFGFLEALAVFLEEAVGRALAADADEQGASVADALLLQLVSAGGKQAVRRALEKQERRLRLEVGNMSEKLAIARFERAEVLALLGRQPLE